jgi:hypothetical protein
MNLKEALTNWVNRVNALLAEHNARVTPNLSPRSLELITGQKYIKVAIADGNGRSAYGFIEVSTGNLFKAASWRAPAKGVRGNIYQENPLAGCGPYGIA